MKRWISVLAPSFALIAGLLLAAQTPTPFPQTLPSNTVVGRLGSGVSGPAEVITFAQLTTAMFPGGLVLPSIAATTVLANPTGSAAIAQAVTLGASLAFTGTVLGTVAVTGDVTASANSFATTIPANTVTNAKAAQMAAFTLKGNATGSTANATDFLISGLTSKPSPAAGDLLIISDESASHALKSVPISAVASVGSVSAIDSKTGAFTTGNGLDTATNLIELTAARRTKPTNQVFLSGSGTYTTPANTLWIEVTLVGGGGGGQGGDTGAIAGAGGATCWNTTGAACTSPVYSAGGGGGGGVDTGDGARNGGGGGAITGTGTCVRGTSGGSGGAIPTGLGVTVSKSGARGGESTLGGAGAATYTESGAGETAKANTGSGGQGGGVVGDRRSGSGGGAGATCHAILTTLGASYTYVVGVAGTAGTAGSANGQDGGAGAAGGIWVIEHYGS